MLALPSAELHAQVGTHRAPSQAPILRYAAPRKRCGPPSVPVARDERAAVRIDPAGSDVRLGHHSERRLRRVALSTVTSPASRFSAYSSLRASDRKAETVP